MQPEDIFTAQELAHFRNELDLRRPAGSHEPGKWMVNPLNRSIGRDEGHFQTRVKLRDITLRTMEQMPGVANTAEQRLDLLRALVEAGVPEVQTSAFRRGHTMQEMRAEVRLAKSINPHCQMVYGGLVKREDMDQAIEAGYDILQSWTAAYLGGAIPLFAGAVYHRVWKGQDWHDLKFPASEQEFIDRPCRLIREAVQQGLKVSMGLNLLALANEDFVKRYARASRDAGAFEIMLADSTAGTAPEAFSRIVHSIKEAAPGLQICIHAHNLYGLGAACSVAGARAGAEVIEVSVNGYEVGPAGCQASLTGMAVALQALYGVDTGVDLSKLAHTSDVAARMTGVPTPWNEPVIGSATLDSAQPDEFELEALFDPLIHGSFVPEAVGLSRRIEVGVVTGPLGMWNKLEQLGITVQREHVMPILEQCWDAMTKSGGRVSEQDIRKIAAGVLLGSGQ